MLVKSNTCRHDAAGTDLENVINCSDLSHVLAQNLHNLGMLHDILLCRNSTGDLGKLGVSESDEGLALGVFKVALVDVFPAVF